MRALFSGIVLVVGVAAGSAHAAFCDGFTDVDNTASYCTAVIYLKDHGITLGCTDTAYCPNAFVTRAQMALFLQRAGQADPTNVLGDNTSAIAGGQFNTADGTSSFVAGGFNNAATGGLASISGGANNTASGSYSTVPGGFTNAASGTLSFAAGQKASANDDGCFVWGDDSTSNTISCNAPNRFVVRALGGIFMFTGGSQQDQYTGVALAPGGAAWIVASDRNGKEHFAAVDAEDVLRRVVSLPISTWNWKNQDVSFRHMGPMAQDFSAAFGLGETPKGISTVDADGVALAAIQGLYARLKDKDTQIDALSRRLEAIEAMLGR